MSTMSDLWGRSRRALAARAKRNYWSYCSRQVLLDQIHAMRFRRGVIGSNSGALHATMDVDASVRYIETIVGHYLRLARRTTLSGPVAELGPGDNLGSLAMMRHIGAPEVHAVDRYDTLRDPFFQEPIYRELAERHNMEYLLPPLREPEDMPGLVNHVGIPAERFFVETDTHFEGIVSWSVMEHLYDPLGALDGMAGRLEPGGFLVHSIDLGDHGMFEGIDSELAFLTVPPTLYRWMTRSRGLPNRVLAHRYRAWLDRTGWLGSVLIHALVGSDEDLGGVLWGEIDPDKRAAAVEIVRRVRPRLSGEFASIPEEDLAISGIQLVAFAPN